MVHHLEYYTIEELSTIIRRSAEVLGVEIDAKGAVELARRSRGTPRLANRLLKRVRDFAQVKYDGRITEDVAVFALDLLEVDKYGLDQSDRRILRTIIEKFAGGRWDWIRWQRLLEKMPERWKMCMNRTF